MGVPHGFSYEYDENGKLFEVWEYNNSHAVYRQEMNGKVKHGQKEFFRLNDKGENEVYRTEEWVNGQLVK
ncbi:hypothetical protein HYE66_08515 [Aggregatibacter actinomycetemcomitans]|nr:hypothetical protein [Aggregatibacter actinomycetemcomitans]